MVHRLVKVVLFLAVLVALPIDAGWGRGRGGGGRAASGNAASRGGQNGGNVNRGGQAAGEFNRSASGGVSHGAASRGGQEAGRFGATPDSGQLNKFLGLPSDGASGPQGAAVGSAFSNRNASNYSGAQGAAAGSAFSKRNASQYSGAQGAAAGSAYSNRNSPQFSAAQGAAASSAYSNRNAPQYSGAQGAAAGATYSNRNSPKYSGAQGAAAGAATASRNAPQFSGAQGAAVGYSAASASTYGSGFGAVAPAARNTNASAVRGSFNNYDIYGAGWYNAHPTAWHAATLPGGAWAAANWNSLGKWFAVAATQPVYYDYGNNVTYVDNSVYVDGESAGTSEEYYDQASTLASTGAEADASSDGEWMPLGVFSLSPSDQPSSNLVVQLSVNKQGVVRGNYTDTTTSETQAVHGAVDLQTQRVAFTVGDNTSTVVETGLYNLTKDEAPALMHFGQDRTEQWLLVRLSQPSK